MECGVRKLPWRPVSQTGGYQVSTSSWLSEREGTGAEIGIITHGATGTHGLKPTEGLQSMEGLKPVERHKASGEA